ncbi:hypothetical protein IWQ60_001284 [Tieghemiomyces parasiticus]|uniref:Amino acid transporter transmembrane domain-containing protein n=1 Tax=Tieghemiomyces parasiticus TaxID=78921 RepID=A0A9W8AEA6_9FUNG|nr:hypothetical protein IWQ60_001284 [Tieghemiomyces parasiticus]
MPTEPRNVRSKGKSPDSGSPLGSPAGSAPRQLASERLSSSPYSARPGLDHRVSGEFGQSYRSNRSQLAPGSYQEGTAGSDDAVSITVDPDEAARVLRRHLVTRPRDQGDDGSLAPGSDWDSDYDDDRGSASGTGPSGNVLPNPHTLLGGDMTHHIYKWSENHEQAAAARKRRSQSVTDLVAAVHGRLPPNANPAAAAQLIKQPGGFRRHFVAQKAAQEGQPPPSFLTRNFIDFIALYGHFAGDDFPSDIDDDDYEGPPDMAYSASYRDLHLAGSSSPRVRPRFRRTYGTLEDDFESELETGDETDEDRLALERPLRRSLITPAERAAAAGTPSRLSRRTTMRSTASAAATASPKKAFFLLMKSFVGTGVLFLPRSFYNGGLTFSAVLLALVAYLALYAMLLLVECYAKIPGSFGDIGLALYGPKARYAVLFSIVFSQTGFCCAYTIFVARSLQEVVQNVTDCRVDLSIAFWVYVQLAIYIPLAMVRKIKNFSLAALVADVFILLGLGYLYYFDVRKLITVGAATIRHFNPSSFSLFIGTAVFTFEGIGLVLPIVSSMKEPAKFPRVLTISLVASAVIFISMGALSYLTFGDKVETVVLLNLPANDPMVPIVQFVYALAIIFSVPLQMFPAIRILEAGLFVRSGKGNPWVKWQKNLFRTLLAFFIASISVVGADKLDRFVALIGSFACIPLSFIYPSLFHLRAVARTRRQRIIDILLCVFGLITMVYVTYTTIESWIMDDPEPPSSICPPKN